MHHIFAQALQPFAPPQSEVHRVSFNDDDWYVVNIMTKKVVRHVGSAAGYKPEGGPDQLVLSGMNARHLGCTK